MKAPEQLQEAEIISEKTDLYGFGYTVREVVNSCYDKKKYPTVVKSALNMAACLTNPVAAERIFDENVLSHSYRSDISSIGASKMLEPEPKSTVDIWQTVSNFFTGLLENLKLLTKSTSEPESDRARDAFSATL